jgi:hypothetical protein
MACSEAPVRPCVGCGYCCQTAKCPVGLRSFGPDDGPCPGLIERDGRYWCGPVLWCCWEDYEREHMLVDVLAVGAGCCSPLFNVQRDAMLWGKVR